jgi:ribosomal protein S18 acetylase RimI-like enzyme
MNDMKIRKARHSDVPELKKLWIEFMDHHSNLDPDYIRSDDAAANWVKYINSKFESDSAVIFVAANDRDIVGYIGVLVREYPPVFAIRKYGFIEEIAVTAKQRRQGIASQLWSAAEEWLQSNGITRIKVNIDVANPESQGFFRSLGFLDDTETLLKKY